MKQQIETLKLVVQDLNEVIDNGIINKGSRLLLIDDRDKILKVIEELKMKEIVINRQNGKY